jgi:hypothetical protein
VELRPKITKKKKKEEEKGVLGEIGFREKGEKWGNGRSAVGSGDAERSAVVCGGGVWIIGILDEEG